MASPIDHVPPFQVMISDPLVLSPEQTLGDVILAMLQAGGYCPWPQEIGDGTHYRKDPYNESRASAVLICEGDRLVGMLTDWDVVRLTAQGHLHLQDNVAQWMTNPVDSISLKEASSLINIVDKFQKDQFSHLLVLDKEGRVHGLITPKSLQSYLLSTSSCFRATLVSEVMNTTVFEVLPEASLLDVSHLMSTHRVGTVVITNNLPHGKRHAIGLITKTDTLQLQALGLNLERIKVTQLMNAPFLTINANENAAKTLLLMNQKLQTRALVKSKEEILGILDLELFLSVFVPSQESVEIDSLRASIFQSDWEGFNSLKRDVMDSDLSLPVEKTNIHSLLKNLPVGVFRTNSEGSCLYVNEKWCEWAALTPEQAMGYGWLEGIYPPDRDLVSQEWNLSIQENRDFSLEYRFQTKDGDTTWVFGQASPELDEQGKITGYVGTITNINDRKKSEEKVHQLIEIIETARDIIASTNSKGQITYLNQFGRTQLGISPLEDISDFHITHFQPSQVADQFMVEAFPTCVEKGFWEGESEYKSRDGNVFPVWQIIVGHRQSDGSISHYSSVARDISEAKKAEQERQRILEEQIRFDQVRKELTLLEQVLDVALAGYWDNDIVNNTQYISPGFKRMFGYEDWELPNSPETWKTLIFEEDLPIAAASYQNHVESHGVFPYYSEVRYHHKDGSTVWVICTGKVTEWDSQGNPLRLIGCHFDITNRKLIEAALAESEAKYRFLVEGATDLVWAANPDGTITYLSPQFKNLFGWDPVDWIGQNFQSLVHPEDLYFIGKDLELISSGSQIESNEFRHLQKNGSYVWVTTTVTASRDYSGRIISLQGIMRDISEQRKANDLLRKQDIHLKTAQRIAHLGSWEFDVVTGAVTWSDEVYQIFGRDRKLPPPTFVELQTYFYPEDQALHADLINKAITFNTAYEFEARIVGKNNSLRYIQARGEPVLGSQGTVLLLMGTVLDITDRKQNEDCLRQISDRLNLAVKSGSIGIWEWDVITDTLTWDDRMYELYGINPQDFSTIYEGWISRVHPDDRQRADESIAMALRGEKEYDLEFKVLFPNGRLAFIKASGLVQRNANGVPQKMIGINYDVTEIKLKEAKLRQISAQLEASNRELEAFAYSVSHDLRAPLRAIDGFSKALLEDYGEKFGEEGLSYFARIRRNVSRMGQLIEDLLRLSRVSRSEMSFTNVDLSNMTYQIINILREENPDRIVNTVIGENMVAYGDPVLMRVVLENLLQNAWKFTGHHQQACIEVGFTLTNNQTTYFVRDDGAGFDMNYANQLFGVFQRLHNTQEFPGTGIGLATVQRVILRHGGKVWAEGKVEQGATFYFTLPNPRDLPQS